MAGPTGVNRASRRDPLERAHDRTFGELLVDVHRTANMLRDLGVQRHNAVAIISPNCDELITATLAAQLAGIAAPINGALSDDHIAELVQRSGARVLIGAATGIGCRQLGHGTASDQDRGRRHRAAASPDRRSRELHTDTPRGWCDRRVPQPACRKIRWLSILRPTTCGRRSCGALPHRWDDGQTETRRTYPRERGHRCVDDCRQYAARRELRASSPVCRCFTSTRWW